MISAIYGKDDLNKFSRKTHMKEIINIFFAIQIYKRDKII